MIYKFKIALKIIAIIFIIHNCILEYIFSCKFMLYTQFPIQNCLIILNFGHLKDQWWVLWLRRIGGKMLACHIIVPVQVLATQLQIKLLADVPGKVADNGPGVWLTATCVRNPDGVPSSYSQPHTIPAVASWDVKCFTFQI